MPKRSWVRISCEGDHVPAKAIHRSTIVAQGMVRCAQEDVRQDLEGEIPESRGDGQGTFARFDSAGRVHRHPIVSAM